MRAAAMTGTALRRSTVADSSADRENAQAKSCREMAYRKQASCRAALPFRLMRLAGTAQLRAPMFADVIDTSGVDALTRLLCEWTPKAELVSSVATVARKRR